MTHNKILKSISKIAPFFMILLVACSAGCVSNMTLTFYVDDEVYYQTDVDLTKSIVMPDKNPKKDGYTFIGWYFDKNRWEQPLTAKSILDIPVVSELSVYAYFTNDDMSVYKVTLDSNGGTSVAPVLVKENGKIPYPDENPERPDYTFVGWYTTPDYKSGKAWDFNADTVTGDIVLYAGWKPRYEADYYLDGFYKQTPLDGVERIIIHNEKAYITYYLAIVEDAVLSVLADPVYHTGNEVFSVSSEEAIKKSTTESLEQSIAKATGGSTSHTTSTESTLSTSITTGTEASTEVGLGDGKLIDVKYGAKISAELSTTVSTTTGTSSTDVLSWDTTNSFSESEAKTYEQAESISKTLDISLEGYPVNLWYRYVLIGDCIITKTYVYDLSSQKIEKSYYDSKIIESTFGKKLQYCTNNEFSPQYDGFNADMSNLDVAQFYKGSGTDSDPFQISTVDELLLIPVDTTKHYQLQKDIDMTGYEWFTYDLDALPHFEYNGHSLLNVLGSAEAPYEIASAEDFLNIYNDLDAHYKLVADIDLTRYTIPMNTEFSGGLDGNGHTIIGNPDGRTIVIDDTEFTSDKYYGLFSKNSGIIKNLKLSNINIRAWDEQHNGADVYVGCVTGINNGIISDVTLVECEIVCFRPGSCIGGVCGINNGQVTACSVEDPFLFGSGDGGGITGINLGTVSSCSISGYKAPDVMRPFFMVALFKSLYYYGVNSDSGHSWGGIAGHAQSSSIITDVVVDDISIYCDFSSDKDVEDNIGYLVGNNEGTIEGSCYVLSSSHSWDGKSAFEVEDAYFFSDEKEWTGRNNGVIQA